MSQDRIYVTLHLPEGQTDIVQSLGRINYDDLRGESERTGGEVVWYGVLAAAAKRRASQAELAVKIMEARLARKYRSSQRQMGEKGTNDEVKELVRTDPEYLQFHEQWFAMEEQASVLESCKFALVQKQKDLNSITTAQVLQAERMHAASASGPVRSPVTRASR